MRRIAIILSFLTGYGLYTPVIADGLVANLNFASFNNPMGQSYIETYLDVVGKSVVYAPDSNNKLQGKINVDISFLKGDSTVMKNSYTLLSPELTDTLQKADFIDVQRYWLKKGIYTLQITIRDKNNSKGKVFTGKQIVKVGYDMDSIHISDAEFLESYTPSKQSGTFNKNGYVMIPYVYRYFPDGEKQISFYAEVYNTIKVFGVHEKFVLKYFIESFVTHTKLFEFNNVTVKEADTTVPLLGGFNIEKLPSGRYFLVVQVTDKNNVIRAANSYAFIRRNKFMQLSTRDIAAVNISNAFVSKMTNKDTLIDNIKSLGPISNYNEKDFVNNTTLPSTDIKLLQQYFYNFWVSRSPSDPEGAWHEYHKQVMAVNREFRTINQKGYETDRGRVYLQYGPPNQRDRTDMNPNSYPYEIWEYYQLKDGEVDKKFVFYDRDLVSNNYILLHSDARGEIQNRQWQLILNSRSMYGQPANIDQNTVSDPWGENTLDEFGNPR